jgi:porphobilinogen deaminase
MTGARFVSLVPRSWVVTLEARCRVPIALVREMAQESGMSTDAWVREVAGTLLPPDFERPIL